jgi:hypothetical protein
VKKNIKKQKHPPLHPSGGGDLTWCPIENVCKFPLFMGIKRINKIANYDSPLVENPVLREED